MDSQLQQIVNRFTLELDLEHMRLKAFSLALGAAHVKIAQKLHLDFFETGSRTPFATAASGVEGESAGSEALRQWLWLSGEQFANPIVKAEIKNWGGTWRAGKRGLIDHHHFVYPM